MVITSSGSNTTGDAITLECSVGGTSDPARFQWFKGPPDNRMLLTSDDLMTLYFNSSISQLQISSLRVSHAGEYTCQATVWNVIVEGTENVNVNCKYL